MRVLFASWKVERNVCSAVLARVVQFLTFFLSKSCSFLASLCSAEVENTLRVAQQLGAVFGDLGDIGIDSSGIYSCYSAHGSVGFPAGR